MMAPGWEEKIAEAQEIETAMIDGRTYDRVPYGDDYPDGEERCSDCGVEHGQLHVPDCCVERCPICRKGQVVDCQLCIPTGEELH